MSKSKRIHNTTNWDDLSRADVLVIERGEGLRSSFGRHVMKNVEKGDHARHLVARREELRKERPTHLVACAP